MTRRWRVLPLILFLVASCATGTAAAATSGQAPQGSKGGGKNDGTYDITVAASTCSDGLAKTSAVSRKLIVEGKTVSIASADGNAAAKTGEVSSDGSFAISSTLPDGSTSTVSGTFEGGRVQGTFNTQFKSGLSCNPTFSGQRAGAAAKDPADELIEELALEEVFEEYQDFCDGVGVDCPTLEQNARAVADVFEEQVCPGGCDQKGFTRYQRTLPDLVFRAQLLAGDAERFPSVKGMMQVIMRMAFHGATAEDPESAAKYASAAWRLFATVAHIDYGNPSA